MNDIAITIIVPTYNAEKFLRKALDSLLRQTLQNIEIIIVNDGSTDSSGNIAEEYKKIDSRFRVIHKPNGGLSSSRNTGVIASRGKYVTFLDADDMIEPNAYEDLYNAAGQHDADVIIFGKSVVDSDYHKIFDMTINYDPNVVLTRKEIRNQILKDLVVSDLNASVLNKLFKRELISQFEFNEEWSIAEDYYFILHFFDIVESAIYIPNVYYQYVQINTNSLVRSFHKNYIDIIESIQLYKLSKLSSWNLYTPEINSSLTTFYLSMIIKSINNVYSKTSTLTLTERYKLINKIVSRKSVKDALEQAPHLSKKLLLVKMKQTVVLSVLAKYYQSKLHRNVNRFKLRLKSVLGS
jgi:glycosyltransferase EpsH